MDSLDQDIELLTERIRRAQMMKPVENSQGTSLGLVLADLASGLGTAMAGGNGAQAVAQNQKLRSDARLKALESQEEVDKRLTDLVKVRADLNKNKSDLAVKDRQLAQEDRKLGIEEKKLNRKTDGDSLADLLKAERLAEIQRKAEADKADAAQKLKQKTVVGLDQIQEVEPTEDDVKKAKAAKSAYDKYSKSIDNLIEIVNSSFPEGIEKAKVLFPGELRKKLQNAFTDATINFKEAANLGALAGPDVALIQQGLVDPTDAVNLGSLDKKAIIKLIKDSKNRSQKNFAASIQSFGYRPVSTDQVEIKEVGGVKYKKVPGGWQETK